MKPGSILTDRLLAVIIPVYNGEKYLEEAVNSVILQPCKNVDVIIIDDGSRDNSLEIAKQLERQEPRITVISQENRGVSAARNYGIEYCLSCGFKYIAFLDSDDVWVKEFYTDSFREYMESLSFDAYQFSYYDGNEDLTRGRLHMVQDEPFALPRDSRFGGHFCSFVYKMELLSKYSIRFPTGIRAQEDEVFRYVFLTIAQSIQKFKKDMFVYRSNSTSVCHVKVDPSERYFVDIIPAWHWAENKLREISDNYPIVSADIVGCMTMIKTFLSEYITVACNHGLSIQKIKDGINQSGYSNLYLEKNDVWVDQQSLENWICFRKYPGLYWCKQRVCGVLFEYLRKLRNIQYIQAKRYPVNLNDLIY